MCHTPRKSCMRTLQPHGPKAVVLSIVQTPSPSQPCREHDSPFTNCSRAEKLTRRITMDPHRVIGIGIQRNRSLIRRSRKDASPTFRGERGSIRGVEGRDFRMGPQTPAKKRKDQVRAKITYSGYSTNVTPQLQLQVRCRSLAQTPFVHQKCSLYLRICYQRDGAQNETAVGRDYKDVKELREGGRF
jgi:hypothetical protein